MKQSKHISVVLGLIFICTNLIAQNYQSAESVEYDPSQNRFLISNGNNILARASDGTLSYFGNGSSSHGLEILGENVFGLSGNIMRAYNLETAEEVMSITLSGAGLFLNGLTSDGVENLYATDFSNRTIYKINVADLNNPTQEIIVSNTVKVPNGIIYDGANNRLIYVTWLNNADIRQVDLSDNSVSVITTTTLGNIDGIDDDSAGNYYISSWNPDAITKYDSNFENPITVSTPGLNSPADIGYAQAIDTLAIPQGNSVDYIGFEVVSPTKELESSKYGLTAFPNPVVASSWIQFELEHNSVVDLILYDMNGNLVHKLIEGQVMTGQQKVLLAGLDLSAGIYTCFLKVSTKSSKLNTVDIGSINIFIE